jgi:2-dehydro-3-deoxyglucarate aldolase/4-hydroxy-2-oxoheptanedioate aldolase
MNDNKALETLRSGGVAIGTMVFEFATSGMARLAASAGADFVVFDQEHTGWTSDTIRLLLATVGRAGVAPFVRVPVLDYSHVARILDVGAMGVMAPAVETAEQARLLVDATRYPPNGRRGASFGLARDDFAEVADLPSTMRLADERTLLIALVETSDGIRNVDDIASVDGIDVVWLGQFDLTVSLGDPGNFEDPRFLRSVDELLAACRRHGKAAGYMATSPEDGQRAISVGFRCIAYSNDVRLYRNALRDGIAALRGRSAAV